MNSALWRVFVPTWRFFDRVGPKIELFVREDASRAWRAVEMPIRRDWRSLVFSPENNLVHANRNLLDRLMMEISEGRALESSVTWSLVVRLAATASETARFQLEVTADGETVVSAEDVRA